MNGPRLLPVVAHANWYQFAPNQRIRYPRVESRMLLWCKAGRGHVTVNDQRIALTPGTYVVLPWRHRIAYEPDVHAPFQVAGIHLIPHHPFSHPVEFGVAHFVDRPLADRPWRQDVPLPGLDSVLIGDFHAHPALEHLAEYVVSRFAQSRPPDAGEMRALARLVLREIQRPPVLPTLPDPLERMMQHVRTHLEEPSDLAALAVVGGCSVATMRRMFQRHVGLTPLAWVSQLKLDHAEQLLRTTSLPVVDIAQQLGFADPFYFSRWFRRHRGRSPRQARQQQTRL